MQAFSSHNPPSDAVVRVSQRNTRKRAIANDRSKTAIYQWHALWIRFVNWRTIIARQDVQGKIWFTLDRMKWKKLNQSLANFFESQFCPF